jgi:coproporphyrinogen III oxidase
MQGIQDKISQGLEKLDGVGKFQQDAWEREEGGGGRSRVMREGDVFEQGGVGFSEVWGSQLPPSIWRNVQTLKDINGWPQALRWCYIPAILISQLSTLIIAILKRGQFGGLVVALI